VKEVGPKPTSWAEPGVPETITIDGSAANEAAIKRYHDEHSTAIAIRQTKYLNNMVEQFYALVA
jgi:putative transposase